MPDVSRNDDTPSYPHHEEQNYDVFLCYNTVSDEDRRIVMEIGNQLKEKGIVPWLDEWEVQPGTLWFEAIEQQIENIKAAVVCVGHGGVAPWERLTIGGLIRAFLERGCRVIPVYLPNASSKPKLPYYLKDMKSVDFHYWKQELNLPPHEKPLNHLIWGITGRRVWEEETSQILNAMTSQILETAEQSVREEQTASASHVLIAPLGVSPVRVSAMYDFLTKKDGLAIDKVVVLQPEREDVARSYVLVKETLADVCELQSELFPFEDANSWANTCLLFKRLYNLLDTCQNRGDTVSLSLASGSESIDALIASITLFFSCVKHLYLAIDPYREYFLSIDDLIPLPPLHRQVAMHPELEQIILVEIPFEPIQQVNQQLIARLHEEVQPTTQKSVLIVPLSKFSMVATQLYTLLKSQDRRNIHKVILVYPAQSREIASGVQLIMEALREEASVPCEYATVPGLEKINSPDACRRYRAILEKVIDQVRATHPDCTIDLALSEGLEGMIPMTIFAAQKKHLSYIYQILITDEQLSGAISRQTTIEALTDPTLSKEQRNDRLFLRAYEDEGVYMKYNLFKIPIATT